MLENNNNNLGLSLFLSLSLSRAVPLSLSLDYTYIDAPETLHMKEYASDQSRILVTDLS